MIESSPANLQSAWDELHVQEDFIRAQRHLSDDDLRTQLVDELRMETSVVNKWVDSGDCFIVSGSGKIHLPTCPSMRAIMDREAAWAPYLDDLERVRDWHGDDNAPPMPAFLARADVEELPRYTSCAVCAPTLDHTDKRPVGRGWTLLKAGSLNYRHFGTALSLTDGTALGALTRISRDETAEGLDLAVFFEDLVEPVTDPLLEVMYRSGRQPQAG